MNNDNIISYKRPEESFNDTLTELLRQGAGKLIEQAVQAELAELLGQFSSD